MALTNGTLIILGEFSSTHGEPRPGLARLRKDGSLDQGFSPEFHPTWPGARSAVLADGSAVYAADAQDGRYLVRVNSNGVSNPNFNPSFDGNFLKVAAQNDGRLLVFGSFYNVDEKSTYGLVRLLNSGKVDPSFVPRGDQNYGELDTVDPLANGKILVTGSFSDYNGVNRNGYARLNSNGTVDLTYELDRRFEYAPVRWLTLRDGRQLVGGNYENGLSHIEGVILLDINGKIVAPVPLEIGQDGLELEAALELTNRQVLLAVRPSEGLEPTLIRLNSDFSGLDPAFQARISGATKIRALAEMSDRSIIIAGDFLDLGGHASSQLRRLNPDGSDAGWPGEAPAPRFTRLPTAATARTGERATFEAAGTGDEPVRYLWFKGLQPIPTATNAVLSLASVQPRDADTYSVLLRTSTRDVQSPPVALTVLPPLAAPGLSIQRRDGALALDFQVEPSVRYRLETSIDLTAWELAEEFLAAGPVHSVTAPTTANLRYWRLRRAP